MLGESGPDSKPTHRCLVTAFQRTTGSKQDAPRILLSDVYMKGSKSLEVEPDWCKGFVSAPWMTDVLG
jgi:hypothetical protein